MGNLERITAKIVEEANEKANFILNDAKNQSEDILVKANIRANDAVEELKKEYDSKEKTELDRVRSSIALKSRNTILKAKQESISYIFDELYKKIKGLPLDKMKEYILKTLSGRTLKENEKLVLPKEYEGMDLGIEYVLSDKIDTGFLIEKNGIYENYTLEALIELKKDEIEAQIQENIFF
ncbi:V-type ATP synthase subunit E [Sneathia vaginalis]|jgi:hypothetical protein|uniref:V-type proton ATPase subunit E n=1 Tax=Sneathia vaginalis TaxID=187101 RepID=A0A0E3UTL4_9FUSO|nr:MULTISPECIES: V-type ATP synthase subunit E [Sneathia]AKC95244.1 hypothetical protein VC03_01475 [Sneathia vaginalis]MBE3031362.1 V-type ATP synthase subunit E [Sneathia sp. DSM 16631]MDK9582438.1 V-type ATP synthase subunit E [Sneathia vaginalis]